MNVDADEVLNLCNHVDQIHSGAPNRCAPNAQPSKPVQILNHRNLPVPGKLRRTDLLDQYHAVMHTNLKIPKGYQHSDSSHMNYSIILSKFERCTICHHILEAGSQTSYVTAQLSRN